MARGAKDHIIGWAAEDWRTSRIRTRSIMTGDAMLRLVYLELLNALYANAGTLPSDPEELQDYVGLPAAEVARCLPLLVRRDDSSRGGLVIADGQVTCPRVTETLEEKAEYRRTLAEEQSERGKRSAEARRAKYGTAQPAEHRTVTEPASNQHRTGSGENVEPVPNQPRTSPEPSSSSSSPLPTPHLQQQRQDNTGATSAPDPGAAEVVVVDDPEPKRTRRQPPTYPPALLAALPDLPELWAERMSTPSAAQRPTASAEQKQLEAAAGWLERHGAEGVRAAIVDATNAGWRGLFEPKTRGQPRPAHRGPFAIVRTTPENDAAYLDAPDVYPDAMP